MVDSAAPRATIKAWASIAAKMEDQRRQVAEKEAALVLILNLRLS
jgi:hypothetical protein